MRHARGVVELVAPERQRNHRHAGGERLDHRPVTRVRHDRRRVPKHLAVRGALDHGHVRGRVDRLSRDGRPGGHQPADRQLAERRRHPLQHVRVIHERGAHPHEHERAIAGRRGPRPRPGRIVEPRPDDPNVRAAARYCSYSNARLVSSSSRSARSKRLEHRFDRLEPVLAPHLVELVEPLVEEARHHAVERRVARPAERAARRLQARAERRRARARGTTAGWTRGRRTARPRPRRPSARRRRRSSRRRRRPGGAGARRGRPPRTGPRGRSSRRRARGRTPRTASSRPSR